MKQHKEKPLKQPYSKPRLRTIDLAAEEVMAIGCKQSPVDEPFSGSTTCLDGICSSLGS